MSIVIYISCDQENPYGICASRSLPARTVEAAARIAKRDAWYVKPNRQLCPEHAAPRRGLHRA